MCSSLLVDVVLCCAMLCILLHAMLSPWSLKKMLDVLFCKLPTTLQPVSEPARSDSKPHVDASVFTPLLAKGLEDSQLPYHVYAPNPSSRHDPRFSHPRPHLINQWYFPCKKRLFLPRASQSSLAHTPRQTSNILLQRIIVTLQLLMPRLHRLNLLDQSRKGGLMFYRRAGSNVSQHHTLKLPPRYITELSGRRGAISYS